MIQATIHRACGETGRDPATVDFWSNAQITFADSKEEAREYTLGWTTNWLTEMTLTGKGIPPEVSRALGQVQRRHPRSRLGLQNP